MTILDPVRRICGLITGPRNPVPASLHSTLESFQNSTWATLSKGEQGQVLLQARAICNAEIDWAVTKWRQQVENRPLANESRRAMDDLWRMVIRRFGGDPDQLLGPDHDSLVNGNYKPQINLLDEVSPVLARMGAELRLIRARAQDEIDHTDSVHHRGLARARLAVAVEIERAMAGVAGPEPKPETNPLIPGDEGPPCFACGKGFVEGEPVHTDVNEGTMHQACCGPEPESFVGADGEPLKPGDAIPSPHPYKPLLRGFEPG